MTRILQRQVRKQNKAGLRLWSEALAAVTKQVGDRTAYLAAQSYAFGGNRPDFWDQVVSYVVDQADIVSIDDPKHGKVLQVRCQICDQLIAGAGITIDHKTKWGTYLKGFTPDGAQLTQGEARVLYNDPNNLQVAHLKCNSAQQNEAQTVTRAQLEASARRRNILE